MAHVPGNYLVTLKGRSGLYAQRAVPKDLQARLGIKLWRRKAGNTASEARRFLAGFLAWTEELIEAERKGPRQLTKEEDILLARGRSPREIIEYWPQIEDEDIERVSRQPPVALIKTEELIEKAEKLKKPAAGTIREWRNCFQLLSDYRGSDYPLSTTKEEATGFRNDLVTTKKASTVKKVIRYLRSHWQLCIDEELISSNIWDGVIRHLKEDERVDKVFDYQIADEKSKKLSREKLQLYWLLRFTGLRIQEALGLMVDDIDLGSRLLTITDNEYRSVGDGIKNANSRRQVPISSSLVSWLEDLPSEGMLFPWSRSPSGRLNTPSFLRNHLGIAPHTLRHHVTTCLRDAGLNERVIGDLLGHAPSAGSMTSRYGTTTIQILREAVEKIY